MTEYTFEEDQFSDLYKDAFGFRPRSFEFFDASNDKKQLIWDNLLIVSENRQNEIEEMEIEDLKTFKNLIQTYIKMGAENETEALKWMIGVEDFQTSQCVECFVWEHGILHTKFGREIVQKINTILF